MIKFNALSQRAKMATLIFVAVLSLSVLNPQRAYSQTAGKTVSGVVLDSAGQPIAGAAVQVIGTGKGTITDLDGNYSLKGVLVGETLTASSLSYAQKEVTVGESVIYNFSLDEDVSYLDEVIVVGYGTTTRRHMVSSIGTVKSDVIQNRPSANLEGALQGTAANLIIQNTNFDPTSEGMNISIRGIGSISNNDPLLVIDGVPQSSVSRMNEMNPEDIESVSILKDAGAAAIYGSRSANGVIILTTKQGSKDMAPTVRFSTQLGMNNPYVRLKAVPSWQNAMAVNEARTNVGMEALFTEAEINEFKTKGDTEMLVNQALQNAFQQSYNLSVSGGTKNTSYMLSGQYFDQASNYVGPNYGRNRYTLRSNIRSEWGRFTIGANISFTGANNKKPTNADFGDLVRFPTYYWVRTEAADGVYVKNNYAKWGAHSAVIGALKEQGYSQQTQDNLQGTFNVDFKIIDGLKLRAVLGGEIRNSHTFQDKGTYKVIADNGGTQGDPANYSLAGSNDTPAQDDQNRQTYTSTQIMLDFNRTFGVHTISAVAGWSQESYNYYNLYIQKNYLDELNQPTAQTVVNTSSRISTQQPSSTAIRSWFGRATYSLMDKYIFELTARYDMSSKFKKEYRGAFFPAASFGWFISNENFMNDWKYNQGDLKLRVSYGLSGNQQNVGDYDYLTVYSNSNNVYAFSNSPVSGMSFTLGNDLLTWETSKTFNVGVDAGFFKNTLTASFDYFVKNTENILLSPSIPSSFGASISKENIGALRNQGWDLTLNYNLKRGEWNHNFNFNMADSHHVITKGFEQAAISLRDITVMRMNGYPIRTYYGCEVAGLFQSYEEIQNSAVPTSVNKANLAPGDVKYVDQDRDGDIDNDDKVVLGYGFPRYTYGFNYNVSWKGFDFSILLQGVLKRTAGIRGELIEPYQGNYGQTLYEHQTDYWTVDNTDAKYPRLAWNNSDSEKNNWYVTRGSSLNMLDCAYLRLKNVQLGYTIPAKLTNAIKIKAVRIFVDGQNLLTFSKNNFVDPEITEFPNNMDGGSSNSVRSYPSIRYFGGGVNITF